LLEALAAIYRPALSRLKRHGRFFAALGARGGRFRALAALSTHHLAPFGLTGLTPLGLVLEAFIRVEDLLAGGEDKISPAIDALEGSIPVFHAWLPGLNWAHLRHGCAG
jgi:hypothetical protein